MYENIKLSCLFQKWQLRKSKYQHVLHSFGFIAVLSCKNFHIFFKNKAQFGNILIIVSGLASALNSLCRYTRKRRSLSGTLPTHKFARWHTNISVKCQIYQVKMQKYVLPFQKDVKSGDKCLEWFSTCSKKHDSFQFLFLVKNALIEFTFWNYFRKRV